MSLRMETGVKMTNRQTEDQNRTKARDDEVQSRVKARDAEDQGRTKARDSEGESRKKPAAADTEAETAPVYLALVHYPVYNKNGEEITTTITNLDLHDISRAGRTYNIAGYYVVNHLKSQQALVQRMRKYWTGGKGAEFNQNRHDAFAVLRIADFLEDVTAEISAEQGQKPLMVTTSAKSYDHTSPVSFRQLRSEIQNSDRPCLILFGTGWGLSENLIADCDYLLEPVRGRGDFNHLSVRSAASIILDRLLAPAWWQQD